MGESDIVPIFKDLKGWEAVSMQGREHGARGVRGVHCNHGSPSRITCHVVETASVGQENSLFSLRGREKSMALQQVFPAGRS